VSTLWALLKALPEIIALLRAIQNGIESMEADRKVKDDVKTIHEALNANDPTMLNALFRNVPATPVTTNSVPVQSKAS
jgi:hypothetical protein